MQPDVTSQTTLDPAVVAELDAVVRRARGGDVTVLPRFREILDKYPEIWKTTLDLGRIVEATWAEQLAGKDLVALESFRRQAEQMRVDLSGPAPTPVETLLIQKIVASWLEMCYAQTIMGPIDGEKLKPAAYKQKLVDSAVKRYLAFIKALTPVRALQPKGLVPIKQTVRLYQEEREQA